MLLFSLFVVAMKINHGNLSIVLVLKYLVGRFLYSSDTENQPATSRNYDCDSSKRRSGVASVHVTAVLFYSLFFIISFFMLVRLRLKAVNDSRC